MSVAQLQKQVTALEREMANAVEAEDFSEAAATKKRLEPLRLELSKLRFSERGNSGSIEEIQKKIEQLEKEMHEASEAEDFEAATQAKVMLEPLRVELGQMKYAEKHSGADGYAAYMGTSSPASKKTQKTPPSSPRSATKADEKKLAAAEKAVLDMQKRVDALERRMVDASELEDFDMATNTKKLLEPLRIELGQLKIAAGMQAEEAAARAVDPAVVLPMKVKEVSSHFMQQSAHDRHQAHIVTDNFAHPSAHDKSLTSAITHHFDHPSTHDKEILATYDHDKPSAHDRQKLATTSILDPSKHDKSNLAAHHTSDLTKSAHDKQVIAAHHVTELDASKTDHAKIATYARPSAHDMHILHPPPKPAPLPKPTVAPDADVEAATKAGESKHEADIFGALKEYDREAHQGGAKPTAIPPAHPCTCATPRATFLFFLMLQGVIVPIALVVIACARASLHSLPLPNLSYHSSLAWCFALAQSPSPRRRA